MLEVTRDMLDSIPQRAWGHRFVTALVYVFPSEELHDSGYAMMDFVAVLPEDKSLLRFGGSCDSVSFEGEHFRMDCMPDGTIRIFNHYGFEVSEDLSSISFEEQEYKR